MKTLLFAIVISLLISCSSYVNTEEFEVNIDLKIVSINDEISLSQDKFHSPQLCNTILFVTTIGEERYVELNTCLPLYGINIDTPWLYNHIPGDTVHFDYLHKSRFFTIKKR